MTSHAHGSSRLRGRDSHVHDHDHDHDHERHVHRHTHPEHLHHDHHARDRYDIAHHARSEGEEDEPLRARQPRQQQSTLAPRVTEVVQTVSVVQYVDSTGGIVAVSTAWPPPVTAVINKSTGTTISVLLGSHAAESVVPSLSLSLPLPSAVLSQYGSGSSAAKASNGASARPTTPTSFPSLHSVSNSSTGESRRTPVAQKRENVRTCLTNPSGLSCTFGLPQRDALTLTFCKRDCTIDNFDIYRLGSIILFFEPPLVR